MSDVVDLRSDTVTRPSAAMRKAMLEAELGDDVFGDDPTVNRLQERAAEIFGFEAALLFPSGTQSNLAALMSHCQRGDEVILGAESHSYRYEAGGLAVLGSIQPQAIANRPDGTLDLGEVEAAIKHNVERVRIDHENAGRLARGLRELKLEVQHHSNMVMVRMPPEIAGELAGYMRSKGILVLPGAPLRLVAHLDVDARGIDRALAAFGAFISSCPAGRSR